MTFFGPQSLFSTTSFWSHFQSNESAQRILLNKIKSFLELCLGRLLRAIFCKMHWQILEQVRATFSKFVTGYCWLLGLICCHFALTQKRYVCRRNSSLFLGKRHHQWPKIILFWSPYNVVLVDLVDHDQKWPRLLWQKKVALFW